MFDYEFMRTAAFAATLTAVLAGCVGSFLVLRGQTFAGHALSHVGFTGAAGALLLGLSPLPGLIAAVLAAGLAMGALGAKLEERDIAVGMVLAVALAFGLLFLHALTGSAAQATALLFGNILGVDDETVALLAGLTLASLALLALLWRPLLFVTLQPELAEARGVRLRLVSSLFMAVLAVAIAACTQVVGVLLVFTLLVAPAAAAQRLVSRIGPAVGLAVGLALAEALGGLMLAYVTDWPVSFWIAALGAIAYFAALAASRR